MPFVPPDVLPASLWRNARYHVSQHLQAVYENELKARNLFDIASTKSGKNHVYGGATAEQTNDHFAHRFSASVVRVQHVLLDAQDKFGDIPKDVIQTFTSHRVSMLDIPCGTGAAGLALISVVHELRLAGIVPMLPLQIDILAGDISTHALAVYENQLRALKSVVESTGISLNLTTCVWNATDLMSTNGLCYAWEQSAGRASERFVLVTNFSGDGEKILAKIKESIRHISARASFNKATLLWVEPASKSGKSFSKTIKDWIASLFGPGETETHELPLSDAKWWHALHMCEYSVTSTVQQYERGL